MEYPKKSQLRHRERSNAIHLLGFAGIAGTPRRLARSRVARDGLRKTHRTQRVGGRCREGTATIAKSARVISRARFRSEEWAICDDGVFRYSLDSARLSQRGLLLVGARNAAPLWSRASISAIALGACKMTTFARNVFALIIALLHASVFAQSCPPGNSRIAPNGRYVNNGDGTITDTANGLMWKQCSEGQAGSVCAGESVVHSWQQALTTASVSEFAGYGDWRLPNIKELNSLVETGCYSPAINSSTFPNTPSVAFWSSTSIDYTARLLEFYEGKSGSANKFAGLRVRLVRSGP